MKNKVIAWVILLLVFFFPFRYAYLEEHATDVLWILNFLLVVIGMMVFFLLTISNSDEKEAH